ncbi:hypothetical protein F4825DRAFT_444394 [Nemania diffusa]|nr:hypothetical protein F4825DRAFT_444394 [Nemania diffusa]
MLRSELECLRYLYFDGLDAREEAIIRPLTGTCSWIWEPNKSSLHRWLKSGHGIYWIQGRPSTGKSTLVKYAVKTAREKALILTGHRPTVLAYFLDSKTSTIQPETMEKIIRVLLWQLLRQDSRYFKFVLPHFEDMKQSRPNFEWKPSVLQSILLEILSHHHTQPIWIFLDGLDEYSGDLFDMADVLNQWSSACSDKVRICISSRPEQELVLSIHSSASILKLEDHTGDDITICAKQEISRLSHLIGNDCCKKLIASISNQANGLFMWVKLASRDIVRTCMKGSAVDYEQLLERLDHLPKEINDLYLKILQKRTDPDDYRKALTMLGIVSFGRRSFTLREFFFIFQSLDSERVNYAEYRDDLVRLRIDFFTGGLLDCRSGRVVFSHGTVTTFVHHLQDQQLYLEKLSVACSRLSQACFVLLHHFELPKKDQYIALPVGLEEIDRNRLQDLRNYAIQHWLDHISCPEMLQKYRLKTATPPHVKNEEFVHWKRSYLARFWEYHPNSSPRLPDLVVTTLAYLLSIITSPSIFSPPNPSEIIYTANDPFFHNHEQSLRRVRRIVEWKNANIDFLITLEITAEYSVSFHAANILNHWDGLIDYIVDPAKQSVPSFEESGVWFDNALRSYSASRTISNLITIRPCALVNFLEVPIPKRRLRVDPSLLDQISIVIWHYIQMETSQTPNLSSSDEQKANTLGTQQDSTMSFSTPVQYAAFFGLDLVIRQLHRHGADVAYFSEESRYGSPLIAAIWGISEKRSTSDENVLIRTLALLDKTERSIVTPGNAGHLGKVTPLNAAVKLYTSYRRRIGLGSEELLEAIACLLELGAEVDQSTRVIVRSNPKLGRYFASTTKPTLPASHAGFGSSAPIDIPSPASLRSIGRRGNASIGGFGNTRISGLTPYGQGPPGRGGARITQTLEERFNL